jgi:hypothetical protein
MDAEAENEFNPVVRMQVSSDTSTDPHPEETDDHISSDSIEVNIFI